MKKNIIKFKDGRNVALGLGFILTMLIIIIFLDVSLIQKNQSNIFLFIFTGVLVIAFLQMLIRLLSPFQYIVEISSKGVKYVGFFSKVFLTWDQFKEAAVVYSYVNYRRAVVFDSMGRAKVKMMGADWVNQYQLVGLLNILKEKYSVGELTSASDILSISRSYLDSYAENNNIHFNQAKHLLDNTEERSFDHVDNDWQVLKFKHFTSRCFGFCAFLLISVYLPDFILKVFFEWHDIPLAILCIFFFIVSVIVFVCLFFVKNIVFFNKKERAAYRAICFFKKCLWVSDLIKNISCVEIMTQTNKINIYKIMLSNTRDRLFCQFFLRQIVASKAAKKIAENLGLKVVDFYSELFFKVLDFIFDFVAVAVVVVFPVLCLAFIYGRIFFNIYQHF